MGSALVPPFTEETAIQKVRAAEDGWNSRDPSRVALAYTLDSRWRNRAEFVTGRDQIVEFLTRKWTRELDYRLIKEIWAFGDNRIAVRFAYEFHDDSGQWFAPTATRTGSSTRRPDAQAARQHQRPADHRGRAEISTGRSAAVRTITPGSATCASSRVGTGEMAAKPRGVPSRANRRRKQRTLSKRTPTRFL